MRPGHSALMPGQRPIIERAFVLARSGEYENTRMVSEQHSKEGYLDVALHFAGQNLRDQVRMLIVGARTKPSD